MAMATNYSISNAPFTFKPSAPHKQVPNWRFPTINSGDGGGSIFAISRRNLRTWFNVCAVTGDQSTRDVFSADFPSDYTELIVQAKEATESAFKDGKQLLEIEFPTAGLQSVPGDGEGGIEMTGSMLLIREFCDRFVPAEKVTRTRIFFPEAKEVTFARQSAFEGCSLKLDYLTKPSLFEDFGFTTKVKMADRVRPEDEIFLVAYPYFNVNEMLVVEELYKEAVLNTERKMIIFNGELDRIRSGYYPPFFYPKLGELSKTFLPKLETVYYIHNFKGSKGGVLFRCYPGPWKVLRKVGGSFVCLHEQEEMPSLKEVALNILPSA
ncbi:protein LPA3-like isoform X2 [Hordeum vulgare subsp. vulgare]|uniref:Predicted protein n=1 Tax=Hordeum vulgare subsp. vulgare TaxID=112509 RepID=F2DD87_HORVV|nr:protein LPA3-like isoform X2 [Hordeum vulgare subsp. vulgare]KAI4979495.1 hypothetical protein ZWY2020_016248 [Hordeum vulgare]BAJ93058.1 predicted protein [Hordeum vulgare subsp. vulgare]